MKGLLICAKTDRSASVWATSDLEMMWAFRIVFRAYIRCVSCFLQVEFSRHPYHEEVKAGDTLT